MNIRQNQIYKEGGSQSALLPNEKELKDQVIQEITEDDIGNNGDEEPSLESKKSQQASVNKSQNDGAQDNDDEGGEEQESRDKIIRSWLESQMTESAAGEFINYMIATISVISCVAFVIMCHFDWSVYDSCCHKYFYTPKLEYEIDADKIFEIREDPRYHDCTEFKGWENHAISCYFKKTFCKDYEEIYRCDFDDQTEDGKPMLSIRFNSSFFPLDMDYQWLDNEPKDGVSQAHYFIKGQEKPHMSINKYAEFQSLKHYVCPNFNKEEDFSASPQCDEFRYSRMPYEYILVEKLIGIIFLVHYSLTIFIAQNRCSFFFSSYSIKQLFTIIPIFWYSYGSSWEGLLFLAISRMIRITQIEIFLHSKEMNEDDNVAIQMKMLGVEMIIMIFTSSVLFMVIENFDIDQDEGDPYVFSTTIYFMFVTLMTVGYGDIYPVTQIGRVFILVIIMYVISYSLPVNTTELLRLIGLKSIYARDKYNANPEIPHVVITGQVVIQALHTFSQELFHPDHGTQDRHAVILQPHDPSNEMEMFLHNPNFESIVRFINGNPMISKNLQRAAIEKAKTCILLTNKNSRDATIVDHKNILTGLAMKKYIQDLQQTNSNQKDMRLCMQLIKPESKQHYFSSVSSHSSQDQIIIVEEIKMNLMSKSCFSPGIINFISNLISSSGDGGIEMEEDWLEEYAEGMDHEIYRIKLSEKMNKKTFNEISGIVYKHNRSIVFAIEIQSIGKTIIRLNPSNFIVNNIKENDIHVYIICPDKKDAEEIETLDMTNEEQIKYFNAQAAAERQQKSDDVDEGDESEKSEDDNDKKGPNEDTQKLMAEKNDNNPQDDEFQAETQDLMVDYYVSQSPISSMNVTVGSLENSTTVRNHIVVCGIHSAIKSFIMPLRARYLKEYQLQKIVIILGEPDEHGGDQIDSQIWNSISRFKEVFLVNGSPLKQSTLLNANIHFADKVVILGTDSTLKSDINDEMLDAESIYIYQAVQKVNKDVQILTELVYSSNIEFLLTEQSPHGDYHLSQLYAAGEVYISEIIDTLTCQSYFNPHIVTILQQILKGATEEDDEQLRDMMKAHPDLEQSNLWQIPVPQKCVNKNFEYLFMTLLEKKLICMALYRLRNATDNKYPYVYTNPAWDTTVTHRDRVFVLGVEIPSDLQGDIYEMVEKNAEVELGTPELDENQHSQMDKQNKSQRQSTSGLGQSILRSNPKQESQAKEEEKPALGMQLNNMNQPAHLISVAETLEKSLKSIERALDNISHDIDNQNLIISDTTRKVTREHLESYREDFYENIQLQNQGAD